LTVAGGEGQLVGLVRRFEDVTAVDGTDVHVLPDEAVRVLPNTPAADPDPVGEPVP
jgi:hypothetical protein